MYSIVPKKLTEYYNVFCQKKQAGRNWMSLIKDSNLKIINCILNRNFQKIKEHHLQRVVFFYLWATKKKFLLFLCMNSNPYIKL